MNGSPTLRTMMLLLGLVAGLRSQGIYAVTESYDPASPEVTSGLFDSGQMVVVASSRASTQGWTSASLGFATANPPNVDGFSDGTDTYPGPNCRSIIIEYTVDRSTVGTLPAIQGQSNLVTGNGAASDTFLIVFQGGFFAGPLLGTDAQAVTPRTPMSAVETDLDALSWSEQERYAVYFSLDPAGAASLGISPASILTAAAIGGPATVLYTPFQLGLVAGDDIDALTVDRGGVVLVSLAPGSPSLGTLPAGPSDVILLTPGAPGAPAAAPPVVVVGGAVLGLGGPQDNLNGIRISDPSDRGFPCIAGMASSPASCGSFPFPGTPTTFDALRIEGTNGSLHRRVDVLPGNPFTLTMTRPPGTPNPLFHFIVFAVPDIPCSGTSCTFGQGVWGPNQFLVCPTLVGTFAFVFWGSDPNLPPPFAPFLVSPPLVPGAPTASLSLPPVPPNVPSLWTLQGIVWDPNQLIPPNPVFLATNAITLDVL